MSEKISCPQCDFEFELTTALSTDLRKKLEQEFAAERRKKEAALEQREAALEAQERQAKEAALQAQQRFEQQLAAETERLKAEIQKQAKETVSLEFTDLQNQLLQSKAMLDAAQKNELAIRKERRDLEDRWKNLELETARKEDELRKNVEEDLRKRLAEEEQFRLADKQKQINDLREQIDVLKRKAEQGSQQAQGEVFELALEELLTQQFPFDTILPVAKGKAGADVIHQVSDNTGGSAGTIIWESKRTKSWDTSWLPRVRDNQRAAKAEIAIVVSKALPKGVDTFALIDGVWVSSFSCALPLAAAVRETLLRTAQARKTGEGQQGKMELLYTYLAGPEFKQRLEGIAETFHGLKVDLEQEKRAMSRIWAKREKQLERAVLSASGLHGDLQGIIGAAIGEIDSLSLEAISRIEFSDDDS